MLRKPLSPKETARIRFPTHRYAQYDLSQDQIVEIYGKDGGELDKPLDPRFDVDGSARTGRDRLWVYALHLSDIVAAKKWAPRCPKIGFEEFAAEGMVNVNNGIKKYDPNHESGKGFRGYMWLWVDQAMGRFYQGNRAMVRVPVRVRYALRRLERGEAQVSDDPELYERALAFRDRINALPDFSLDALVEDGKNGPGRAAFADLLEAPAVEGIREDREEEVRLVSFLVHRLDAREKEVLRLRFGFEKSNELTFKEVADMLRLSRQRIGQIQEAAIRKLQDAVKIKKNKLMRQRSFGDNLGKYII